MAEDQFDKLARLIKEEGEDTREQLRAELGTAIADSNTKLDQLTNGVSSLGTRVDKLTARVDNLTARADEGFLDIGHRLGAIDTDLDRLAERAVSNSGFAKEIDGLRAEVRAIKHHLGLAGEIAA